MQLTDKQEKRLLELVKACGGDSEDYAFNAYYLEGNNLGVFFSIKGMYDILPIRYTKTTVRGIVERHGNLDCITVPKRDVYATARPHYIMRGL